MLELIYDGLKAIALSRVVLEITIEESLSSRFPLLIVGRVPSTVYRTDAPYGTLIVTNLWFIDFPPGVIVGAVNFSVGTITVALGVN